MRFVSDKFTLDGIHCSEKDVSLAWGEDDFISYGLEFKSNLDFDGLNWFSSTSEKPDTIKLNIVYEIDNIAQVWDEEKIREIENWVLTDDFIPFISEDNEDTIYYFKGIKVVRKMNAQMEGWLEVEFQPLSNFGYKKQISTIRNTEKYLESEIPPSLRVINQSDVKKPYFPVIKIKGLKGRMEIKNVTTDKTLELTSEGNITIDNKMKTIYNDKNEYLLMNSNREWLYLNQGLNIIQAIGVCDSISIISQYEVRV